MLKALALLVCPAVAAATLGGWGAYTADEIRQGSRVANLAKFAMNALSRSSNSLELQRAAFAEVRSAEHQVVAGEIHRIVCAMRPEGTTVTLTIFEQSWTQTLELSAATLSRSDNAMASDVLGSQPLTLDAAAFASFAAAVGSDGCSGGRVWKECGSPCDRTCDEPAPMCIQSCEARCECPHPLILREGACVAESECSAPMLGVDGHGTWKFAPSPPVAGKANLGADGHGVWGGYPPSPSKKAALGGAALKAEPVHANGGRRVLNFFLVLSAVACLVGAGWALRSKFFTTPEAARGLMMTSSSSEMSTVSSSSETKG